MGKTLPPAEQKGTATADSVEVRCVAIYRLFGISKLPDDAETQPFVEFPDSGFTATLTTDPEPYFFHIDHAAAVGVQLLKGLFSEDKPGIPEGRVAAELHVIRERRVTRQMGRGKCFLVLQGAVAIPAPDFRNRRDAESFAVCVDAFPNGAVRVKFTHALQGAFIALGTALPERADGRIEALGEVAYIARSDGKPIYSFTMEVGPVRPSLASPFSRDAMQKARERATAFSKQPGLLKIATLLIESQEVETNDLKAFVAAWSALEIFVDSTFKDVYQGRWRKILESNAPASAAPYFDRLEDVMTKRHRLTDKFVVIASILTPNTAENDTAIFKRSKAARDGLFHRAGSAPDHYPVDDIQTLLWKYLDLHLADAA